MGNGPSTVLRDQPLVPSPSVGVGTADPTSLLMDGDDLVNQDQPISTQCMAQGWAGNPSLANQGLLVTFPGVSDRERPCMWWDC